MKLKTGPWVGVKLTPDQTRAQRIVRYQDTKMRALCDALRRPQEASISRAHAHQLLDRLFDRMESEQTRATGLFPEVRKSLVIASGVIPWE
jgi:hypothetical protein